ncbi:MAG: energy transducer TonB [Terriglobia bacterium]
MRRLLLATMLLASALALAAQTETPEEEKPSFRPAETLSVSNITYPLTSVVYGTVVLDVLITEAGKIQRVEVRRDIPSLTQPAVSAVKEWEFSPATLEEKAISSRMPVAVTFCPPAPYADPVPLPPLLPQSQEAIQAEFQPAEVLHAVFPLPKYPATTLLAGAAVLEVTLSAKGEAEEVKVLRDLPPLTAPAQAVVKDWRFMPAAFNGKPVPSKTVIVFVAGPLINLPDS